MPAFSITLSTWRWRNDDGSESSATWIAANGTNPSSTSISGSSNQNIRIRYLFSASTVVSGLKYSLTYSLNGGSAVAVSATSGPIQGVVSSNLTDAANTTMQMGESGTYAAVPGVVNNTSAIQTTAFNSTASTYFEVEFSLVIIGSAVNNGDTLSLAVVQNTGVLLNLAPGSVVLTISKSGGGGGTRRRADITFAR